MNIGEQVNTIDCSGEVADANGAGLNLEDSLAKTVCNYSCAWSDGVLGTAGGDKANLLVGQADVVAVANRHRDYREGRVVSIDRDEFWYSRNCRLSFADYLSCCFGNDHRLGWSRVWGGCHHNIASKDTWNKFGSNLSVASGITRK